MRSTFEQMRRTYGTRKGQLLLLARPVPARVSTEPRAPSSPCSQKEGLGNCSPGSDNPSALRWAPLDDYSAGGILNAPWYESAGNRTLPWAAGRYWTG
jgi:hypothetical protein